MYDFIFYFRKHNKENKFLINLVRILSERNYKVCIIGEKLDFKKNISYKGFVTRKNALNLISASKYSLGSFENLFSFFVLDCLSSNLRVFFNNDFKLDNKLIKTNLLVPIDFTDSDKSLISIENSIKKNKNLGKLKYNKINFNSFFN